MSAVLEKLLDRLYASLVQGPCLNCRPHASRQRLDLTLLQALQHLPPAQVLPRLLTGSGKADFQARVPVFRGPEDDSRLSEGQQAARRAWDSQSRLLQRLRDIAEDARDYEQETGENALYLGYPLLSLAPGAETPGAPSPRILAPVALIATDLQLKRGATPSVSLAAKGAGIDLVIPNFPLLAWLEQQTGIDTSDVFADEQGTEPYREINEIACLLARALELAPPEGFTAERVLDPVPRVEQLPSDVAFLNAAVLGLFPVSNQGLLRDLKAMAKGDLPPGPVERFLTARRAGPKAGRIEVGPQANSPRRSFAQERLVTSIDPCQNRAVRQAQGEPVLVVHGPPGTGKSQTITNIIGDHLARGERVLMVCDKRTAIDVVHHRLARLGLDDLCAVVHDPQRDQRSLYMSIRDRLEQLIERQTDPTAANRLERIDAELQQLHTDLTHCFAALGKPPTPGERTFHDLVGEWFEVEAPANIRLELDAVAQPTLRDFKPAQGTVAEVLARAREADCPRNPWAQAAGIALADFLAQPISHWRRRLAELSARATELDRVCGKPLTPLDDSDLAGQAQTYEEWSERLRHLAEERYAEARRRWGGQPFAGLAQTLDQVRAMEPAHRAVSGAPLDFEWASRIAPLAPTVTELTADLETLRQYEEVAARWYGFICFRKRAAACRVTTRFGVALSLDTSRRLATFLEGLKSRLLLQEFGDRVLHGREPKPGLASDVDLLGAFATHRGVLEALRDLREYGSAQLQAVLTELVGAEPLKLAEGLGTLGKRARLLAELLGALDDAGLFSRAWLASSDRTWRRGETAGPILLALAQALDSVETILRMRQARDQLPASLHEAVDRLVEQNAESEAGGLALHKALLAKEISQRIRSSPFLSQIDQERMDRLYRRYGELEEQRPDAVREAILHRWVSEQKSRLLAGTGTQLNADGAALKRRLVTRGERALKLRQMIQQGGGDGGPDPLFDVCPVWMASPATVALVFPRRAVFDLVIFDEASQCRLEEAVPVLTRGKRVVIAGDPQQLPPSRFFETSLVDTEVEEAQTEEALFEQQQGEAEDLLGAALNLEVPQCYLDVHYRSRHEGLIGFSNRYFYHNRLQPLPTHPARSPSGAPIRLLRADGVYAKRGNAEEARIVCDLVAELLARPAPPSIGIACFNLPQRDLILDGLEERAERETGFAERLAEARERQGAASFEGLFVKNLENVQGDERDHLIISTTFGPDAEGRFRRHFGPLAQAGGGRRLNVLVTRAREMIHVVCSIPRQEYAALPELESGQTPNGRWLLYAYLRYTEDLRRPDAGEEEAAQQPPTPRARDASTSILTRRLALNLEREHGLRCQVSWGNAGFCVDIAAQRAEGGQSNPLGVLCDMTRFGGAVDPVEWELFRWRVLRDQGWRFLRVWSPGLFANPEKQHRAIARALNPASTVARAT